MTAATINHWRSYFQSHAGADIFEIIDKAIAIAAWDHPKEFEDQKDRIVAKLLSKGRNQYSLSKANVGGSFKKEFAAKNIKQERRIIIDFCGYDSVTHPTSCMNDKNMKPNKNYFTRIPVCLNEESVQVMYELSKRMVREGYQRAAKKQRRAKVLELHELPKLDLVHAHNTQRNSKRRVLTRPRL